MRVTVSRKMANGAHFSKAEINFDPLMSMLKSMKGFKESNNGQSIRLVETVFTGSAP